MQNKWDVSLSTAKACHRAIKASLYSFVDLLQTEKSVLWDLGWNKENNHTAAAKHHRHQVLKILHGSENRNELLLCVFFEKCVLAGFLIFKFSKSYLNQDIFKNNGVSFVAHFLQLVWSLSNLDTFLFR